MTIPPRAAIVIAFHGLSWTKSSADSETTRYVCFTASCATDSVSLTALSLSPELEAEPTEFPASDDGVKSDAPDDVEVPDKFDGFEEPANTPADVDVVDEPVVLGDTPPGEP
jgi:hypothetical protein